MKTYFLTCDEQNHHTLLPVQPLNIKSVLMILDLNDQQVLRMRRLLTEMNHKHQALKLAAEVRFLQKRYYKARRTGDTKFNINLYLTTSIDKETMLDKQLADVEKNFGRLYEDPNQPTLEIY